MENSQSYGIFSFVERKKFTERVFIDMVLKEIENRRMKRVDFARRLGLKGGNSVNAWERGESSVSIDQAIAICAIFQWRPAWALFGEGPMTDAEENEIRSIRDVIWQLSDEAKRAIQALPQSAPLSAVSPGVQPSSTVGYAAPLPPQNAHTELHEDENEDTPHKPDEQHKGK